MIHRDVFALFLFARRRYLHGLSPDAVTKAAGVPVTCVRRAEERRPIGPRQFEKLCGWMGERPEIFDASRSLAGARSSPLVHGAP